MCRGSFAASLRSSDRAAGTASSLAWSACLEAEAEDRRYWASRWDALESELLRLQAAAQLVGSNATGASTTRAPGPGARAAGGPAAPDPAKRHRASPLAGIKLNLDPKSTSDLLPGLAMLKALYEEGKQSIAELNSREAKSKQFFVEKEALHKHKLADIEAKFENHTLSAEFRTNETHDEERSWNYWQKVHERQHRQFHTSLKIQHATMQKEKMMMDMYEKTISGKADKSEVVRELNKIGGGTSVDVVFLQRAGRLTAGYCAGALAEVRVARRDLEKVLFLH